LLCLKTLPHQFEVEQAMDAVQRAVEAQLGSRTLKDLVRSGGEVDCPDST